MEDQWKHQTWTLRRKMQLVFICVFLVVTTIGAVWGLIERQHNIADAEKEILFVTRALAAKQEDMVVQEKQLLTTLANLPEVKALDISACNRLFAITLDQNPQYNMISLSRLDGMMIAAAKPFEADTINLAIRKFFQDTVRTQDFSAGEYVIGSVSKLASLHFSYPVRDARGNMIAVLATSINLKYYGQFAAQVDLPVGMIFTIADHRGVRLYRWPQTEAAAPGTRIPEEDMAKMQGAEDQGSYRRIGSDGVPYLAKFKRLRLREKEPFYCYIISGFSETTILEEANQILAFHVGAFGLVALIVFVLVWFLIQFTILKPIQRLVSASNLLGMGQLSARTHLPRTQDEFGQLAESFDEMAERLEDRERILKEANKELERRVQERTMKLQEKNDFLDLTGRTAKVGGWRFEVDTWHGTLTDEGARICEFKPGQAVTVQDVLGLVNEPWQDVAEQTFKAVTERPQPYDLELEITTAMGSRKWVRISGAPVQQDGRVVSLSGAIQDITERKRAEETNAWLAAIVMYSDDAIIGKELDGTILTWNRGAEQIYGYAPEEVIGRPVSILVPDGLANELPGFLERIRQGESIEHYETVRLRKDGRRIDVSLTLSPIRDVYGRVTGASTVARDITDRKRAEEALQTAKQELESTNAELTRHRDHLEDLVRARTRELAVARDAAESSSRAKSTFLANVGHELRTPMNQIMGMGYLLAKDLQDESAKERLTLIQQASQNLLRLIDDILAYSRMESEQIQISTLDFELIPLLDRSLAGIRDIATGKGIELVREADPDLSAWLKGDPIHIQQILGHLLDNAVKFSDQGRITLRARRTKVHHAEVTVRFEIQDQGIGIAPEQQAWLFQLFQQGDDSTTRKYGGTGLGLAFSKRLVSLMAGEIGVESTPGRGSTFWFSVRLPIRKAPVAITAEKGPVDWKRVIEVADYLDRLLDDGDIQSQTLWGESRSLLAPVLKDKMEEFEEALNRFDFETALLMLREAVAASSERYPHS